MMKLPFLDSSVSTSCCDTVLQFCEMSLSGELDERYVGLLCINAFRNLKYLKIKRK